MTFQFNVQKAIQAAAVLLRREPKRDMDKKRLLAMLYIADRDSLKETGRPIVGGHAYALPFGPVQSEALELVDGKTSDEPVWSEHFQILGHRVELREGRDPGILALSRYEIGKLNQISDDCFGKGTWDVADDTHKFKEYDRNKPPREGKNSVRIPLEHIIDAIGRGDDEAAILQYAKETAYFNAIFGGRLA